MAKKIVLPPKPKREVVDFLTGKIVHWFDGVSDNKNPKLISLTVLSTAVDGKGRLVVYGAPTENLPESHNPSVSNFYLQQELVNWQHLLIDGTRAFAISNPFFLTEAEIAWLSKVGKSKDYRDHLIGFMDEVNIHETCGRTLLQYGVAMHNWIQFWRSHKLPKII